MDVPKQVPIVSGCLCRTCLGHNCTAEENLEFKMEVKMFKRK